ncbi:zinc finger protein 839 isoform X2 [Octodon degus]|uniref:Zinc finger protein 839 isoform X2 n=1 Tax=Octodon degus TaxID=10160 RepID=A0A6P6DN11_OCTDE|nr:zinc finger protein 839 isoform X2 [Octodon degus]
MADAESETEGGSERGGGRAPPGRRGSAAHVAPLGPEQLRRVLAQVTRVQPPPPPTVLQEAAQQAAVQHAPGTDPPRLPPQQLEAICVKLTSGDTKGQKPTLLPATIRPQPAGQSLLPRSQLSLVGLGVQPVAPQGPVPTKRVKAVPALGSQDPMPMPSAASGLPTETPAMPGSAHLFPSGSRAGPAEKFKKTPKVKTRSGRISRPPKHKAKDYKFIRTEDLAAGRPSDSDDYSDLSAGDEEEQQAPRALFAEASCALQPRAFRCQACDKAYIGQGGLARHWRLNPGHGWQQPEEGYTEASPRDLAPPERGTPAPSRPEPRTLAVLRQRRAEAAQGSPQCVEDEEAMMLEPESSAAVDLRSGAAQPRACSQARLREVPAQPRACSQARLRESLQQCAPEDLVELVLPRLAQVATVYEFLLAKAKDGGTAQPCFPAVYREFEELHCRVSSMYQELLGRASPASGQPLDVRNPQVAESLGITGFLRKAEAHSDCTAAQHHSMERAGQRSEEARSWQGACEAAEQAPTAWRPRQAVLPMTCPECPAAHSRDQEIPGLSTPTAHLGFTPPASGTTPPPSEGSQGLAVSGGDTGVSHAGCQLKESADSEARCHASGLCSQDWPRQVTADYRTPCQQSEAAPPRDGGGCWPRRPGMCACGGHCDFGNYKWVPRGVTSGQGADLHSDCQWSPPVPREDHHVPGGRCSGDWHRRPWPARWGPGRCPPGFGHSSHCTGRALAVIRGVASVSPGVWGGQGHFSHVSPDTDEPLLAPLSLVCIVLGMRARPLCTENLQTFLFFNLLFKSLPMYPRLACSGHRAELTGGRKQAGVYPWAQEVQGSKGSPPPQPISTQMPWAFPHL